MAHSNQLREFLLTDHGIELQDVYTGPEGVLTGSSRLAQEAREKAARIARGEEIEAKRRELERARQASEAQSRRFDWSTRRRKTSFVVPLPKRRPASNGWSSREWKWPICEKRIPMGTESDAEKGTVPFPPSPVLSVNGENA